MYNCKEFQVTVGSIKFHTIIKYDKKEQANKYDGKDDQNCMFVSVTWYF